MASASEQVPLELQEQIARINKMQAELTKVQVDTNLAVWPIVTGAVMAAAALFGAGIAFAQIFMR